MVALRNHSYVVLMITLSLTCASKNFVYVCIFDIAENAVKTSVTVVVFWRPSDFISVRAVLMLEALQRAQPSLLRVVSVIAPKYDIERELSSEEGTAAAGGGGAGIESLLLPGEIPTNILLDANFQGFKVRFCCSICCFHCFYF